MIKTVQVDEAIAEHIKFYVLRGKSEHPFRVYNALCARSKKIAGNTRRG